MIGGGRFASIPPATLPLITVGPEETFGADRRSCLGSTAAAYPDQPTAESFRLDVNIPTPLTAYCTNSPVALAIAEAGGDQPLLLVNPRFTALTGYAAETIVGRNCRLLQRDADNSEARGRIRRFLADPAIPNVRTTLVNFRADDTPFINLLYMSKLRQPGRGPDLVFASQFDISRSQPELLAQYDAALATTLQRMSPILAESGMIVDGSLVTIANSAATIAQAKMLLASLNDAPLG